ncbi:malonate decarboxylase holo-ACP synthase [Cytobacillus oceanisediminis]|uniref:malonate decarboxylase holo-ACP synthase n=1 Tax=Cytobacillus oceanisediminis TaxID=665099 RepID=UPI001FB3CE7B|nr:malonate decarboxylase holo-ACP synthase [Cytobacillus oceanisediminis]UOE53544.1 malonate decarboxylase holo-ACP synthase [Cytobacillus oceanisediminis]
MVIEPHDLLKIEAKHLISHSPIPDWAIQALSMASYVVVRRANAPDGQIAIGIRGKARSERFGAFIPIDAFIHQIKPEHLAEISLWENKQSPVFFSLKIASEILEKHKIVWGPGGSVGFELATGLETVTSGSDLDIVVRAPKPIPVNIAAQIVNEMKSCPARVDIQAETPAGSFSLLEYAKGSATMLVKTKYGPLLCEDPWEIRMNKPIEKLVR